MKTVFRYLILSAIIFAGLNLEAQKRFWVGSGNWNDSQNWSLSSGGSGGASVPTVNDTAVFNSGSTGNCILDVDVTILALEVNSGYTDSLKQSSYNLTIGNSGAVFNDGVFVGGNGNLTTMGIVSISGGVFICPSAKFELQSALNKSGGSFVHNGGLVKFRSSCTVTKGLTFYDLDFSHFTSNAHFIVDSSINVLNNLSFTGQVGRHVFVNNGIINLEGDFINNLQTSESGTVEVKFSGVGKQVISSNFDNRFPSLTIDKSDTLLIASDIKIDGSWNYLQGIIDDSTFYPTVFFTSANFISGHTTLRKVSLGNNSGYDQITVNTGDTLTVEDTLFISAGSSRVSLSGFIDLKGHLISSNNYGSAFSNALGAICFSGSGQQDIKATGTGFLPPLEFRNTGTGVVIHDNITVFTNWNHISGVVDALSHTPEISLVTTRSSGCNINGKTVFHTLSISGQGNRLFTLSDTITVNNLLLFYGTGSSRLNGGVIKALGDISVTQNGGMSGTGTILIAGSQSQILTGNPIAGQGSFCRIKVEKPADTLFIKNTLSFLGTFEHVSGVIDGTTFYPTLYLEDRLNYVVLAKLRFHDVIFDYKFSNNITLQDTIIVENDLTLTGSSYVRIGNGSGLIDLKGNFYNTNTSNSNPIGTVPVAISGTGKQYWYGTDISQAGKLPKIIVNKTSDTLVFSGYVGLMSPPEYVGGIVDAVSEKSHFQVFGTGTLNSQAVTPGMEFYNLEQANGSMILGSDVKVKGNLFVGSSAALDASTFTIELGEDFIVDGTFTMGQSEMLLRGDSSQSFSITTGPLDLYRMVLQKGADSELTLLSPLQISDTLVLDSGFIVSTAMNKLSFLNGSGIKGGDNNSFVKGPVSKVGDQPFSFPVGKGSEFHPVSITSPSTGSDMFTAEYFDSTQVSGSPMDTSIEQLSTCEYWILTKDNGSSGVKVGLGWNSNSCQPVYPANMKVVGWDGSLWKDYGSSTYSGNSMEGFVSSDVNISQFGAFTLGSATKGINGIFSIGDTGVYTTITEALSDLKGRRVTDTLVYELLPGEFQEGINMDSSFTYENSLNFPVYFIGTYIDNSLFFVDTTLTSLSESVNTSVIDIKGKSNIHLYNLNLNCGVGQSAITLAGNNLIEIINIESNGDSSQKVVSINGGSAHSIYSISATGFSEGLVANGLAGVNYLGESYLDVEGISAGFTGVDSLSVLNSHFLSSKPGFDAVSVKNHIGNFTFSGNMISSSGAGVSVDSLGVGRTVINGNDIHSVKTAVLLSPVSINDSLDFSFNVLTSDSGSGLRLNDYNLLPAKGKYSPIFVSGNEFNVKDTALSLITGDSLDFIFMFNKISGASKGVVTQQAADSCRYSFYANLIVCESHGLVIDGASKTVLQANTIVTSSANSRTVTLDLEDVDFCGNILVNEADSIVLWASSVSGSPGSFEKNGYFSFTSSSITNYPQLISGTNTVQDPKFIKNLSAGVSDNYGLSYLSPYIDQPIGCIDTLIQQDVNGVGRKDTLDIGAIESPGTPLDGESIEFLLDEFHSFYPGGSSPYTEFTIQGLSNYTTVQMNIYGMDPMGNEIQVYSSASKTTFWDGVDQNTSELVTKGYYRYELQLDSKTIGGFVYVNR